MNKTQKKIAEPLTEKDIVKKYPTWNNLEDNEVVLECPKCSRFATGNLEYKYCPICKTKLIKQE